MKTLKIFSLFLALSLIFSSCIEHEVIPAPVNTVDLNAAFIGFVNGTQVEFTQNVNGYGAESENTEDINPSPSPSKMTYGTKIKSLYNPQALRVKFGAQEWDVAQNAYPTVSMFNEWLNLYTNAPVGFSDQGLNGVEVEYVDNNGVSWLSRESDPNQSAIFEFTGSQSDNTGDYAFFKCTFTCLVWRYNTQTELDESINIENGIITSWFKK
ncbi:hypothetical protein OAH04_03315 [Crocinitomicaceae bacterium]|jgi:hypothetical protein|nr:hypothetical protein [Crocinitomicaceae bacterium]